MSNLKVVSGTQRPNKPNKASVYLRVLTDLVLRGITTEEESLKAFYHLARFTKENHAESLPMEIFYLGDSLLRGISTAKFSQYFPPTKEYDGAKYQMKDYFTSMKAIKDQGETIKDPTEFLWDYQNTLIMFYVVAQMSAMSHVHEQETGKSILEDFFGIEPMRLFEDNGKQYLYDPKNGKTTPVKPHKKKPKWIKAVK